jgi:hypothetical protein
MGLDFYVYWSKKGAESEHDWKDNRIAYGRKCWELVRALNCDCNLEQPQEVKLEDWNRLIKKIDEIAYKFPLFTEAADVLYWDDASYTREQEENCYHIFEEFIDWHEKTFDESPTLGFDFALGYIRTFYEADKAAQKVFADPDKIVYMEASY